MANLIKNIDVAGVHVLQQLDNGVILSTSCIKGFLKYLPVLKRLELEDIELKEWQLASNSVWSDQKVLYFGNAKVINEKQCFIMFVLQQGILVLIELIKATIKLEISPLFELACKTMTNLIKDRDVKSVRRWLQLDNGLKLLTGCIEGFLKYVPIFKRLELDEIELN